MLFAEAGFEVTKNVDIIALVVAGLTLAKQLVDKWRNPSPTPSPEPTPAPTPVPNVVPVDLQGLYLLFVTLNDTVKSLVEEVKKLKGVS